MLLNEDTDVRRVYLKALLSVMTRGAGSLALEEAVIQECAEILIQSLEDSHGGSEYCSQALCAASLLLSKRYFLNSRSRKACGWLQLVHT